ncbi:hypothetical protein ACH5RR_034050 [Cinchona calisaya]|uniref:Uncharacterized protein n=1 Tax=Cinchona calisaya TaxID=153742 RepID=A0ABD2Y9R8_9GENT
MVNDRPPLDSIPLFLDKRPTIFVKKPSIRSNFERPNGSLNVKRPPMKLNPQIKFRLMTISENSVDKVEEACLLSCHFLELFLVEFFFISTLLLKLCYCFCFFFGAFS